MRCRKSEKWMSDLLDGRLSVRKQISLDQHLKRCEECRVYKQRLETIRREARSLSETPVPPDFFADFPRRLEARLVEVRPSEKRGILGWKRGWLPAAAGLLVVIFLALWLFRPGAKVDGEVYVLSLDEAVGQVVHEIGGDAELEIVFNSLILATIEEIVENSYLDARDVTRNPLLWEELSEEDWRLLESEIKKDRKS